MNRAPVLFQVAHRRRVGWSESSAGKGGDGSETERGRVGTDIKFAGTGGIGVIYVTVQASNREPVVLGCVCME